MLGLGKKARCGLGWKMRDRVTGFEGIVDHIAEYHHQGQVVGLQPVKLDKDGNKAKIQLFDLGQLEVVDSKPLFKIPAPTKPVFKYGDEVRDKFTGYQGKVFGRAIYLNGCAHVYVKLPFDSEKHEGELKSEFLPENSLELVKPVETPKKKTKQETRGGPAPDSARW